MIEYIYPLAGMITGIVGVYFLIKNYFYRTTIDDRMDMKRMENRLSILEANQDNSYKSLCELKSDLSKHGEEEKRQWDLVHEVSSNTATISTQLINLETHYSDMKDVLKDINTTLKKLNNHETRITVLESKERK